MDEKRAALLDAATEQGMAEVAKAQALSVYEQALANLQAAEAKTHSTAKRRAAAQQAFEDGLREAEAAERAGQVDVQALALDGAYQAVAAGKPWNDGLYEHQWSGMRFGAAARRFLLGDGMGLGKTRTVIGWLDLVQAKRVVIVCMSEVAPQFAGEVEDLAPHRVVTLLSGQSRARREQVMDALPDEGVVVVNFELIGVRANNTLARLIAWGADTVVVDEAHTLKARGAQRNLQALVLSVNVDQGPRVVQGYAMDDYLATRSVKNLALTTGTPILNEPGDIFPILHLIDPLLFAKRSTFDRMYTVTNYSSGRVEFKPGGLRRLKELLAAFYIARTYEDAGIVLPEQRKHVVRVDVDEETYPAQRRVIRQIAETARITLEDGRVHNIMDILSLLTRKRQANVWPAGITITDTNPDSPSYGEVIFSVGDEVQESAKLDAVIERILIERAAGRRQVVFSQFKSALAELERRLAGLGVAVARFDGDTARSQRAGIKDDFYKGTERKYDVILANYKTGGTGLNLIQATVTHILDSEWNPGKRDQALARTHRVGQTEVTDVYDYRVPGSIDTYMANLVRQKETMIGSFDSAVVGRPLAQELAAAILNEDML